MRSVAFLAPALVALMLAGCASASDPRARTFSMACFESRSLDEGNETFACGAARFLGAVFGPQEGYYGDVSADIRAARRR